MDIFDTIGALWKAFQNASLILIDIPIGLPHSGKRNCDVEARRILKQRASSVFPVPCREALKGESYVQASKLNKSILGVKLSIQTWNILGKIREVDEFLRNNIQRQGRIKESHPEVCFWALARGRPMVYSKKSAPGFIERHTILEKTFPTTREIAETALQKFARKDLARDDILDATVLAVSAALPLKSKKTIPENPPRDQNGLPMEIVFFMATGVEFLDRCKIRG